MSASGVAVFDKTLQITNVWLDEIMAHQGPDRQRAWHILSAVLHTRALACPPIFQLTFRHSCPCSCGVPTTINMSLPNSRRRRGAWMISLAR
ncbi:hypothetical protein M728_003724 (plasmid) [Ensifer sp. WSM1721]